MKHIKFLLTLFLTTLLGVGQMWATDATDVVAMKGFAGITASGYQNTTQSGESENGIDMVAYAYVGSSGQVRGNKTAIAGASVTSADANKNWSLYNSEAMPGAISKIEVTQTATGTNAFQNKLYVSLGTSSQGDVTVVTSAQAQDNTSGAQKITFTIDGTKGYTYFKLLTNEKFTGGSVSDVKVTITYDDGQGGGGTPTPSLSVAPTTIDFGTVDLNADVENKAVAVTFANLEGSVTYSGLSSPFTASGTISASGDEITIAANTASAGKYSQTLTVQSATDSKSQEVTVKMNVVAPLTPIAGGIVDELKISDFGVTGGYTAFTDKQASNEGHSDAVYAGKVARNGNSTQYDIQMNTIGTSTAAGREIATSTSGGYAKRVQAIWATQTAISANRKLTVYGSESAYTGSETLATGTMLGDLTYTEGDAYAYLDIDGDYPYIQIVANGAIYMDQINVTWVSTAAAVAKPAISGTENFLTSTEVSITCATDGATIYYTTNGSDPKTVGTEYSGPFSLTESATVHSIANFGSDWSEPASKTFTKITPLTVAQALDATPAANQYVAGVVASVTEVSTEHGNATYTLKDAGEENSIIIYRGKYLNNVAFTSVDQIEEGDEVTVFGEIKVHNEVNQFTTGNYIVAMFPKARLAWSGTTAGVFEASLEGGNTFPTLTNSDGVSVSYSSSETSYASFSDASDYSTLTLNAVGSTVITATFAGNSSFKANSASYTLNVSSSVIKADISFECNGATSCPETMLAQSNLPSPLPTITKAGYNFGGWWTTETFEEGTEAVAGAAVESTDAITLYAKWLDPYSVTEALSIINALADGAQTESSLYVAGIVSTAPTAAPSSGKLTFFISVNGDAENELQAYNCKDLNNEAFDAQDDIQVGDVVTIFGPLKKYIKNAEVVPEFNTGYLYAFNRPVVPSISADPVAVDAAAHTDQSVTITYENWGTVNVADAEATLWDNEACDEAFSGDWISNVDVAANFESVSFDIAANTGAARTAYMKIYALGDDATTEAEKVIAISQEAYVAPALPASLPFAFDGGRADIATTQGMSQEGLDTDYASSPLLKFKTAGAWVIIEIASAPGKLTYDIKGNSFSDGTFKVQESADGSDYSDVATYTELGDTQSEEKTLAQTTRFVKFIYTEKVSGNVALGNIAIAAPVAVETPTFSPAGGAYTGTQSVELSCTTEGATIYYTTNGDDPDDSSTEYTAAISVDATMTIKAIAYKGDDHSEIASASYTITAPLTDYYEKVTSGDVAEGTYLIVYEVGNVAFNGGLETLDASSNTIAVNITNENKIGVTETTAAATFYIDPTAGTIKAANGKYIGQGSDANGLTASDNALVNTLSIDEGGDAVIVSAGGAYLRYNANSGQERFRYFKSTSYTGQKAIQLYKLHGEVIKPASGLAWDPADDIEITVGGAFSAPTLSNPNNIPAGDITIASSNTELATVTNGEVALVENATGTTTITATYTGETYKPITVSYKIKVNPANSIYVSSLNVNFGSVAKDAVVADKTITVTLTNVAAASAVLSGSGASAFSIDKAALTESGDITISASSATAGTFAATLTISDDAGLATSKEVSLSLTVTDEEPSDEETPVSTTSKWVAATEIADGMQVLIVGERNEKIYAVGAQTSNNRTAVEGSLSEGVFSPGENTMAFTVVAQEGGTYALQASNGKYLYAAGSGSGKNYLRSQDEVDDNAKWTLSVSSATANGTSTNNKLQLNNSSDIFSCYSSTQKAIQFYVPYVAPTYVAQIGETKYESLPAAVAAAQDGQTVNLLMDVAAGPGVMITTAEHKQIIIDFGNHTYCATSPVGSAGTQNQAFHFEKDCNITLQNGTITSSGNEILMLIQNYGDLTLMNITLIGNNLPGTHRYVLSNNCGNVVIGAGTTITAKEGDVAFNVCVTNDYPEGTQVTVEDGATITGIVEYHVLGSRPADNKATLTIEGGNFDITWNVDPALAEDAKDNINVQGGTFNAEVPADYCAPGYIPQDNGSGQYGVHYVGYYERGSLTPGNYATICLPNGGKISGASLFDIEYYENSTLYLLEVEGNAMVAGRPYIFLPSSDKIEVTYTDNAGAEAGSFNGLVGSLSLVAEEIEANAENYILYNNQYWLVNSKAYVGANRAYIHMDDVPTAPTGNAPGRRRVSMKVNGPKVPTGFENIDASETPMKLMIDGQIYILRGEKMYDTTGRLVK